MADFYIPKTCIRLSESCWFWGYKSFCPIPWEFDLKILLRFWNCVGCDHLRGHFFFSKSPNVYILLRWSFWYAKSGVLIWFHINPRNFNPRNFQFWVGFWFKTIFAPSPTTTTFISKDAEFSCASFDTCEKFVASYPNAQTPTQILKSGFSLFSSQGQGSS